MRGEREARFNLPNLLSFGRLAMVLPIAVLLYIGRDPAWTLADALALVLYAVSFGTDLIDGWLARRMGMVTELGQLLDPLADKALITCTLVFLTERGAAPAWAVVAILVREIAVTGLRGMASAGNVIIPASRAAKTKTLFQSFAVLVLLAPPGLAIAGIALPLLGLWLLYIAVLITLYSGAEYFYYFFRAPKDAKSSTSAATTGPATR